MIGKRKKPFDNKKQTQQKVINKYEGYIPKKDWQIETVDADIAPEEFFQKYISTRTPVLLQYNEKLKDQYPMFGWTQQHMIEKAGKADVFVEKRQKLGEEFGTGKLKVRMPFEQYLKVNEEDKDKYYMTTQKIPYDDVGPRYLCDTPMIQLLEESHYKLPIIGNLIPNQINTWMGFSGKTGSKTGLHHDYHDNIYLLVKGKKQFVIASPVLAETLETNGKAKIVHKNGLIAYNTEIHSDGHYSESSDDEEIIQNQGKGEQDNLCPKQLKKQIKNLEDQIAKMKEQLDQLKGEQEINKLNTEIEKVELELEDLLDKQLDIALQNDDFNDDFEDALSQEIIKNNDNEKSDDDDSISFNEEPLQNDPDNFVWYHQVSSFGDFHYAINIWMHPPNNSDFDKPYKSDFWEKRYEQMFENTMAQKQKLKQKYYN